MRKKDTSDVVLGMVAAVFDAIAVFGGFMLATWIRFDSGLIVFDHYPNDLYMSHGKGAAVGSLLFLVVFRYLGLYIRPQIGRFENKIPRIVRAVGVGLLVSIVAAYLLQNAFVNEKVSTKLYLVALVTITACVLLERYILYRIEWNLARHSKATNNVLILGTDPVASHLMRTLQSEPTLRSKVLGFLRTDLAEPDEEIPAEMIVGTIEELNSFISGNAVDQIILTNSQMGSDRIVDMLLLCEQNLIMFNMVPDLFRIMTSSMDVQSLDDIPLLGSSQWPLDFFWNRTVKRAEDIAGSIIGLLCSVPFIVASAIAIKKDSPGSVFFTQKRCGEGGKEFDLYKLRTMRPDAEAESGPVWTKENDPRKTRVGGFLRRCNIDELPQFWNVLKGDMTLVGPRPERPHFVEQFREDISKYMRRHVSKPGMTGWAQINGLRGNTSIEERIKYDLYYLENWSLAFDFKILLKTLFSSKNAY